MARRTRMDLLFLFLITVLTCPAPAQTAAQPIGQAATPSASNSPLIGPSFDVNAAVEAYFRAAGCTAFLHRRPHRALPRRYPEPQIALRRS